MMKEVSIQLNRRSFLHAGAGALSTIPFLDAIGLIPVAEALAQDCTDSARTTTAEGLVMREKDPLNLESPFASLNGPITPSDSFYVRSHFPTPKVNADSWRLRIEGLVDRPIELSLPELKKLPPKKQIVTLECAGNGRVFLTPKVEGAQWQLGAVSTAEWTGVSLADVLDRAGIKAETAELILEGSDEGQPSTEPRPGSKIHFGRSLPIAKAKKDVLLAYEMNGKELAPAHGFPLRAIVPGWYAMASVKWLKRIIATEKPFMGYFQSIDYAYWKREENLPPVRVPITTMQVKAQIARPTFGEVVQSGSDYRIFGAAWSDEDSHITRVEVSTDGGKSYTDARFMSDSTAGVWRLWESTWNVPAKKQRAVLMARATDSKGITQPEKHDRDNGGYIIHHVLPVEIEGS